MLTQLINAGSNASRKLSGMTDEFEEHASNILDNGLVRVTTAIAVLVFVVVATWTVSNWFNSVEAKLDDLRDEVGTLSTDKWHRREMRQWCRETELKNPGWQCADISRD